MFRIIWDILCRFSVDYMKSVPRVQMCQWVSDILVMIEIASNDHAGISASHDMNLGHRSTKSLRIAYLSTPMILKRLLMITNPWETFIKNPQTLNNIMGMLYFFSRFSQPLTKLTDDIMRFSELPVPGTGRIVPAPKHNLGTWNSFFIGPKWN